MIQTQQKTPAVFDVNIFVHRKRELFDLSTKQSAKLKPNTLTLKTKYF